LAERVRLIDETLRTTPTPHAALSPLPLAIKLLPIAMSDPAAPNDPADSRNFIDRWRNAGASERANAQQLLIELANLLSVERPANHHSPGYTFEFPVKLPQHNGTFSEGRIDLYKRGSFVLEAKQFADPQAAPSPLAVVAEEEGVYEVKKKSGPLLAKVSSPTI
jgi:hypothetical protein